MQAFWPWTIAMVTRCSEGSQDKTNLAHAVIVAAQEAVST